MRSFLIELQSEYEKIVNNQIGRLEPGLSDYEVVSACKKITENIKVLRADTEKILKESLYPMLDGIKDISPEDEADLFSTVQKIFSFESRVDPGLALQIYQKLLFLAREKKDDDKILKYLYWCGVTLYFFQGEQSGAVQDTNGEKILAYFEEGASYAKKYYSFEDPETRKYIHRCLGNQSMVLYSMDRQQKAAESDALNFSFWNGLIFSGKDPDFPWFNYFFSCLNYRYSSISEIVHSDPDSETKEALQKILDTAISIDKLYQKNRDAFSVFGGARYEFILWDAQFLCGLISFDQLCGNVDRLKEKTDKDDYSANALYIMIQLESYLVFYASKMQRLKDKKDEIINRRMQNIVDYFFSIPMTVNPRDVNERLQIFITNLSDVFKPDDQMDFLLKMTTFRHIPTYAHSIMVSRIASCITEYLAAKNPGCFTGFMDIETEKDVEGRVGELCDFAKTGGLCHDIGKITFAGNPFMHARVLTENEFEKIKRHPTDGYKIMSRKDGGAIFEGYSDIILGHHKYYDNSGGYPENFDISKSKYKIMIDIIAAADSIDSATDDIGKVYTGVKDLKTVCEEIKAEAGHRYSPAIAALLEDGSVRESLTGILTHGRREAYYTAYLHAWS